MVPNQSLTMRGIQSKMNTGSNILGSKLYTGTLKKAQTNAFAGGGTKILNTAHLNLLAAQN
jgi:hypothetical protein